MSSLLDSWINENTHTCFYPKRKDYSEINKWIQEDKNPDDSWLKNQKIKVIKKYRSLEKEKRGLNKYLLTLQAFGEQEDLQKSSKRTSDSTLLEKKDVLCNRLGIEETNKDIGKRISRWLIGAPDREGGRKMREAAASHE
ncbi:uncharacterized protein LOC117170785 [Belonocnema kinseyi]|uniref:uncharacterized protein LOC117170785 n=1 Tax=Belonocnema kinseyi TaxID=2817044 RepID=UPI00143CC2DA|nr:uncharacterized protein LOC117170785 [Belonocnema kinseyi]